MNNYFKTDSVRRLLLAGAAAVMLAACGGKTETPKTTPSSGTSEYLIAGDHVTGSPDAKVTLVEYASVACGHCGTWHNTVYPEFKKKFVDTGKVRYVFREYVTGVPEYADAGFMIAQCAPEENYFKNIAFQFKNQSKIFDMGAQGKARDAYIGIAKSAGLSEDEFIECMQNQDLREKYRATMQTGVDMGITATPAFIINGEQQKVFTLESMEDIILPILGEPVPDRSEKTDDKTEEKEGK